MPTEITLAAQIKAQSTLQTPQLVLQIDGVDTVFGVGEVKKFVRIGDTNLEIGDEWKIGGLWPYDDQLDVIDLDASSNTITQQLLQDRGGTSSVPSVQISLIDQNELITQLVTPGVVVDDILGRKASVYLGYQETAWPQDFVRIFSGVIDEVTLGPTIILNVAHPEQKKRAEIFQKITTELTAPAFFRAASIQFISYQTRRDVVGTVTVTYIAGATVGNEIVTVAGNNIVVQIQSGVTEARHIRNAIERSTDALALVDIRIDSGKSNEKQTIQPITNLDSASVLEVTSTKGMLLPNAAAGFRTYVRINDEVIEYTGLTDTTITGLTRGAFELIDERSEGASHKEGDTVDTFYRLEGSAIDIALRVLMSGGPQYYVNDIQIKSIVNVEGLGAIPNAVWFDNQNIQDAWGVTVGDRVTITGDSIPTNNVVDAVIADVVATVAGSYIVLNGVSLTPQTISTGFISFASKWNVLPKGAGLELGGDEVDVPEFERIKETFASSILPYDFYLKDSIQAKDFLDSKVLFPTGAFTLPRKGKISLGYTSPPLGAAGVKVFDSTNTARPEQTKIKRSTNRYFYNNVLFRFNEAVVDDRFLSGDLEVNQDSKNRIPVGNKTLLIDAPGLRPGADAQVVIDILKRRFQDKYKFGAELVSLFAFYGDSFNSNVGDVVLFGDSTLQLPDTKKGSRGFAPRLFEILNMSLSFKTGEVRFDFIDSGYAVSNALFGTLSPGAGRYGVISPSSLTVAAGSSGTRIKIKNSFETQPFQFERTKWAAFFGERILIHDEDWDNVHETVLLGFSNSDPFTMLIADAPPFVIADNFIVDVAFYPETNDPEDSQLSKRVFVYTNPTVEVVAGISQTQFVVSGLDASKFLEGALVIVRDPDWDFVSAEVNVVSVLGSTITVSANLGFVPLAGYEIDLIGFKDGGAPYRYL